MRTHWIEIYFPSKDAQGETLPAVDREAARKQLHATLAGNFGGFTRLQAKGGWTNRAGKVIEESIDIYRVATPTITPKRQKTVKDTCRKLAAVLRQQAVALQIDKQFYLISAE